MIFFYLKNAGVAPPSSCDALTDTRYQFSAHNDEGVLVLSRHKRAPPTAEQLETKKQKKVIIKKKQLDRSNLSHKVIALHECGCYMPTEFQFLPKKSVGSSLFCRQSLRSIGKRRQQHRSFFRALNTTKNSVTPHLEIHRDCRGENRKSLKRKNAEIIVMCDEMISEKKTTAQKVLTALSRQNHTCSPATIYRITRDLLCKWTKP